MTAGSGSLRILQVHNRYRQAGGEDAVVEAEASLLREAGHEVHQHHAANPSGLAAAAAFAVAPWNPRSGRQIVSIGEAAEPDVVHIHNTWFSLSPSVARRAADIAPVVMTLHNFRLTCANGLLLRDGLPCTRCVDGSAWNGARYRCYRGLGGSVVAAATVDLHRRLGTWARSVDVFIVLTEFAAGVLEQAGLPADKLVVRPNFTVDPGTRTRPASQSNKVLFVGRLSHEKGITLLLDAWRQAAPRGLELEVIGDGPDSMPPVPGVTFLGRLGRGDVTARMLDARALLFPSVWFEGMPMTVLEAMAAGLPVMASRIGGLPELVGPTGEEWLVDPSVEAWMAAFSVLEDGAVIDHGSRRARLEYERRFTPAAALESLEAIYGRVRPASL